MQILFVTPDLLGYGGIQYCNRLALQALREVFGSAGQIHVVSQMDATCTLASAVGEPCFGADGRRARMGAALLRLINGNRWDAVLLMHLNYARLLSLCVRHPPTLVMLYGVEAWRPLPWPARWGLRRIDRLASISDHTRNRARTFNPWMANLPHEVCHLGVPLAPDDPPGNTHSPEDQPYVLSVGRMEGTERGKGFDELLGVWPRLRQHRPRLKLVLVGDGSDRPRLEAVAKQAGADVRFLGQVDNNTLNRYYKHCTCFSLTSRQEGFGLVYLEAMRFGRPVLAGSTDAGAEIIPDRVAGRVVDPTNQDQLLEAILDVTGPNAAAYGAAAYQWFLDRFTYAHFRDRFVALAGRVLDSRRNSLSAL